MLPRLGSDLAGLCSRRWANRPGAPSYYRPPGAVQEDAWGPMIPVDRTTGDDVALSHAHHAVIEAISPEAMVNAAGVAQFLSVGWCTERRDSRGDGSRWVTAHHSQSSFRYGKETFPMAR